jgi:site-specific DNA recombinase
MEALILARVSTEEQMTEGQSIPAQLAKARQYARNKDLKIKKEFQFDESSLKDKRKKFEFVVDEIKRSKKEIVLIVETVDRLQRSFKESVMLDEFRKQGKLQLHFIRENLVIHKDSNSSEIQRWDLAVFVAKSYVLQISDNVKRTNELKIRNHEWTGKAPIGYKNVEDTNGNKTIVIDTTRSNYVIKIFEMYASGNASVRTIQAKVNKLGLTSNTKTPKQITTSKIYAILINPFYYGVMKIKGELHPHKYPPLISKDLFDNVQEVRNGFHKKPFKYASKPSMFRGLITCAECGCMVSPEKHRGKMYYACTNHKKKHKKRSYFVELEPLKPIEKLLKSIKLTDKQKKDIIDGLRAMNEAKTEFTKQSFENLQTEYNRIEKRISRLVDAHLDGSITQDIYEKKINEYQERKQEIIDEMQKNQDADENYFITINTVLSIAQRVYEIFNRSEIDEKRQFLNFLFLNMRLNRNKLVFDVRKPFDTLAKYDKCFELLPEQDSNL